MRRFIGRPSDGDIVLLSDEEDPQLRRRFTDITADSFTWRAELSRNDGTTWHFDEQMLATRADRTSLDCHLRPDLQTLLIRSQIIRATVARQLGMVFQDTVLFHTSIRPVLACRFEVQSARPSRPDNGRNSNQHRSSTVTQQASWRQRRIEHGVRFAHAERHSARVPAGCDPKRRPPPRTS